MGESSSFLVPSFSQPSRSSNEEKKGNPLQRALTSSISFGRYMSESLDWEKWSAFTQNRHLEEVERYSRPGSVAEKKAYFEAHFKRRRAAALLVQQNAAADEFSDTNTVGNNCSVQVEQSLNTVMAVRQSCPCEPSRILEDSCNGGAENVTVPAVLAGNPVEINDLQSDGSCGDIVPEKEDETYKEDSIMRNLSSASEKKHEISSCAPYAGQIMPVQLKNGEKTPDTNNTVRDSSNKRRSYTTSLHMSIDISPSGGIQKAIAPCSTKTENSRRVMRAPPKNYKTSIHPQKSTRASVNDMPKKHSSVPPPESSRTEDVKLQSSSAKYSQTSNKLSSNARLTPHASSFTFKTEERAERRKEFYQKLEKSRSRDAEKQQVPAKCQLKARSNSKEFKDLRNSLVLRAAKNAEVPPVTKLPSTFKKEVSRLPISVYTAKIAIQFLQVPAVRPCIPKVEERAALKVQGIESGPPRRFHLKTGGTKSADEKINHLALYSAKHLPRKSRNENASPNIVSGKRIEEPEHCL